MRFHVVCRVGATDAYLPQVDRDDKVLVVALNNSGSPHRVRENVFDTLRDSGLIPPARVADLLRVALAVYSADLRVWRNSSEDRWTREFMLHLTVDNPELWEAAVPRLVKALTFLTGDHWEARLRETPRKQRRRTRHTSALKPPDKVCLFSGGLDSFAGAVDLLSAGQQLALVGHYQHGSVSYPQRQCASYLQKVYPKQPHYFAFRVAPPDLVGKIEDTMRSRSFLFLALGTTIASCFSPTIPLVVPENGLISLNIPFTAARAGSLSTRTTHPHFVGLYAQLLAALDIPVALELPFRFLTKGEMLGNTKDAGALKPGIPLTMSCAHPGWGRYLGGDPKEHCGFCLPCLIRRAALHSAGIRSRETYFVDVAKNPPNPHNDMGRDLRAIKIGLRRLAGASEHRFLFEVLKSGPIPSSVGEFVEYAAVYRRGLDEIRAFLAGGKQK